jgi:hypothetical protein
LHLIANSYPWRAGDEILVMAGDFPSDILPWLMIARRCGVCVIRIRPRNHVVAPDELEAAITPRTRLFCTTWVHSFSGFAIDLEALGAICRSRDVTFVLNGRKRLARALSMFVALPLTPSLVLDGNGYVAPTAPASAGFVPDSVNGCSQ